MTMSLHICLGSRSKLQRKQVTAYHKDEATYDYETGTQRPDCDGVPGCEYDDSTSEPRRAEITDGNRPQISRLCEATPSERAICTLARALCFRSFLTLHQPTREVAPHHSTMSGALTENSVDGI